ncbi:hypothetical protein V496_08121 [Pseudogymnoascus sp. VKM F-4515 (FW-2607)]|nr:hypothetical protein V496_08121 [Pseudogymnoascus sp. VKM F-4515 (FW-2607)]KFY95193.1 hypothetical protein V498_03491 [Pseudogymnoascus sp. VKM F-4517 (FW-2822)]
MDLVSSIRKEGSRGGVDFKWSDVESSTRRENYLGHSLMAPVGRWQKNRDLNWYAKADDAPAGEGETEEEKKQRLRKEEIKAIKEAEEDALARALGLPVKERVSDANATPVGQREISKAVQDVDAGDQETEGQGRFGGFVGAVGDDDQKLVLDVGMEDTAPGGLAEGVERKSRRDDGRSHRRRGDDDEDRRPRHRHRHHHSRRDRPRSSSRGYRHERSDRYRHRERTERSRSPDRRGDGDRDSQRVRKSSRGRRNSRDRGNSREIKRRERSPDNRQRDRSRERAHSRERRGREQSPDTRPRERSRRDGK